MRTGKRERKLALPYRNEQTVILELISSGNEATFQMFSGIGSDRIKRF